MQQRLESCRSSVWEVLPEDPVREAEYGGLVLLTNQELPSFIHAAAAESGKYHPRNPRYWMMLERQVLPRETPPVMLVAKGRSVATKFPRATAAKPQIFHATPPRGHTGGGRVVK